MLSSQLFKQASAALLITGASFFAANIATATTYTSSVPYAVSGSGDASMCTDDSDNGPFSFTANMVVQMDDLGNFSGVGPITVNDTNNTLENGTLDFNGAFDPNSGSLLGGGFNAVGNSGGSAGGSLNSGKFNTDNFTLKFSGGSSSGMYSCNISGTMKGIATALNAEKSGYSVLSAVNALLGAQFVANSTNGRLGSLLFGTPGGESYADGSFNQMKNGNGFNMDGKVGLAAGDMINMPVGVWGTYTRTWADSDNRLIKFDMDRNSFMGGIDVMPTDDIVVGIAFGYEDSDIDTDYNGGNQDVDGYTIAPYVAWHFADLGRYNLTADLTGGRTEIDVDQKRVSGGQSIRADVDARRWFWAGNLNASRAFDNWFMASRFGVLWSEEDQDAYTESNNNRVAKRTASTSQWTLGMDVSYTGFGAWEPFGSVHHEKNFHTEGNNIVVPAGFSDPYDDDDDFRGALGVRYFGKDGISGSVEWDHVFGRDDYDEDNLNFLIRVDLD